MSDDPDHVYVLMSNDQPLVAHTREQGAAMEMVSYPPAEQKGMWVAPVRLVDDGN